MSASFGINRRIKLNDPRLSKSGIEYLDYQWGIFSGCENHLRGICGGGGRDFHCWAQSLAFRFPALYPDSFNPHYYPEAIDSPRHLKKPSIISVGWVGDVIGYGLDYKEQIYSTINACPWHTFLFLTKNPDQLIKWGNFPSNCWVGVSVTHCSALPERDNFDKALNGLSAIEAKVKYVSFEPLLAWNFQAGCHNLGDFLQDVVDWVIIGSQTKPYKPPLKIWVDEITEACKKAGIPYFLKDNLKPLMGDSLVQDMPK